jgi:hypothetical protein
MPDAADPHALDLDDFDAVTVMTSVVVALRAHAILTGTDALATVTAPPGWHGVKVAARPGGHVVVGVRYTPLSPSRWHNVAGVLNTRGWQPDEDAEGATRTFPPGSEPTDAAFEALATLSAAGAPAGIRQVTAFDGEGRPVPLDQGDD